MSTKVDTKLDISKILSMLSSAYSVYGYGWKLKISAKKNHNRKSHKQLKFLIAEEDCPESVKQKMLTAVWIVAAIRVCMLQK